MPPSRRRLAGVLVTGPHVQSPPDEPGIDVFISGASWSSVVWKNTGKVQITGGASLKAAVPKGTAKTFRFVNPDGGEVSLSRGW